MFVLNMKRDSIIAGLVAIMFITTGCKNAVDKAKEAIEPTRPVLLEHSWLPDGLFGEPIATVKIKNNGGSGSITITVIQQDGKRWTKSEYFGSGDERIVNVTCTGGSAWTKSARIQAE
jgi:hypothetical protein